MLVVGVDEVLDHVGDDLGVTSWIDVPQARIDGFAEHTEDRQWIHVDVVRAKEGPYGGTIAHGYLTLSLASHFLFELIEVEDAASVINYGLDRVRFSGPVPSGSRLLASGSLTRATVVPGGVQTTITLKVHRDLEDRPVMVAEVLSRFLR